MSDTDITTNRRTVLKKASVAAAVGVVGATGSTSASHCHTEYDCKSVKCSSGYNTEYTRECCEDPDTGDVTCTHWESTGNCCL